MDPKNFVETAAPTPFGWVITTQGDFDLNTMLAFRSQLASLSKYMESHKTVAPVTIEADVETEVEMLQPMPLRAA